MNLEKKFTYKNKNQIWKLHIADDGKERLVIETRDVNSDNVEVYFHCLELADGKKVFRDLQLEEKSWVGIETIYNNIIFFHKYAMPNMPAHKGIIAFDIDSEKILWKNEEFVFRFVYDEKVYASFSSMTGEKYFELDYKTGEINNPEGVPQEKVIGLSKTAAKDYSQYTFPEIYDTQQNHSEETAELVRTKTKSLDITGNIEYAEVNDLLLMNFHFTNKNNSVTNKFIAFDKSKNKIILEETLNKTAKAYVPDSFFLYKDFLFLLKEKNQVKVFNVK